MRMLSGIEVKTGSNERPTITVSRNKEGKLKVNKVKSPSADGKTIYWNMGLDHFYVKDTADAREEAWNLINEHRKDGLFDAIV